MPVDPFLGLWALWVPLLTHPEYREMLLGDLWDEFRELLKDVDFHV